MNLLKQMQKLSAGNRTIGLHYICLYSKTCVNGNVSNYKGNSHIWKLVIYRHPYEAISAK